MAIVQMTSRENKDKPNVRVVCDYPGHEENRVYHDSECPNRSSGVAIFAILSDCTDHCKVLGPLFMETTYEGKVLAKYERNWYDDSDFLAVVWDDETDAPKHIEYASTRGWTYPNHADVDATSEVIAKHEKWLAERAHEHMILAEETERKTVRVGKRVRIVKGKKHKGNEGVVTWQGANSFRTYYRNGYNRPEDAHNQRIKVEMDNGESFFTEYLYAEVI